MLKDMFAKTEIQVALIAMIGVFITIIGSIITINKTNSGQIEQQRIEAVREMKRTYYNQLTEAYTKNLMFIDKPDSIEKVEANIEFLKEASRLPLYASQDMVEFIENMKNPEKSKETGIEEFYIIMRNDLCSDKFIKFDNLIDISISIPNKVLITDLKGDKKIQEIQKNPH